MLSAIKKLLTTSLTWWNGQTVGTWLYTKRFGVAVGQDDQGNKYYQNADKTRRWVIYAGQSEASKIPPDWHAWLHKMVDETPEAKPFVQKNWEKPHQENMTGTAQAYVPQASLMNSGKVARKTSTGDYEAWTPDA